MEPRMAKLARLGIEPDAIAILEKYGKLLPRDIKVLDEKALADMKLDAAKLGHLNVRRLETLNAIEAAKGKIEPELKPAPKTATRKKAAVK